MAPVAFPVLKIIPLFKPMFEPLEMNNPDAEELQLRTGLVIVTLLPTIWLTNALALLLVETSNCALAVMMPKKKSVKYFREVFKSLLKVIQKQWHINDIRIF